MKNNLRHLLVGMFLLVGIYSCSDDGHSLKDGIELTESGAGAKKWYSENKVPKAILKYGINEDTYSGVEYEPDWSYMILEENEEWEILEFGIMTFGRTSLMDLETYKAFESTKEDKYKRSFSYYIYMKDKKTQNAQGFLMTVVPSFNYLQAQDINFGNKICYFNRDKTYSGLILFYTLNGEYVNGWRYTEGEIISTLQPVRTFIESDDQKTTKSASCTTYESWTVTETCYYWYIEAGGSKYDPHYSHCESNTSNHHTWQECEYLDEGNGGGYGGDGVRAPANDYKQPEERTDCDETNAFSNAKSVAAILRAARADAEVDILKQAAKNKDKEWSAKLEYVSDEKYPFKMIDVKESEGEGDIETYIKVTQTTLYAIHTHHDKDNDPGPSVYDISSVLDINSQFYETYPNKGYNFYGAIIYTYNGSAYLVHIDDKDQAYKFQKNNQTFFDLFDSGLQFDEFMTIRADLLRQNYSETDAYDFAMSFILDNYKTGLKISRMEDQDSLFKELHTEEIAKKPAFSSKKKKTYKPQICP